jgi:hypothetical protein
LARNPYLAAYRLQWRHRRRTVGGVAALLRWALPAAVAFLMIPLVRPVFLGFLDRSEDTWGADLLDVGVRAGLLLVAVLALDVYAALIRSPHRAVLDLHPVDAAQVVSFEVVRVAEERAWLPLGLALRFSPVGLEGHWGAWGLLVAVILGSYAIGLSASAFMHLSAVEVAENERWGALLDLLRGKNPRTQAAFIYAPGVVLAAAGAVVWAGAQGAMLVWQGQALGYLLLAAPLPIAALAWWPVAGLAPRTWFRASPVLADIDARWASLEHADEAHRVYLDWVVPRLPARVGRYVLKDLRHGWRTRRIWVTGPWLGGLAAAAVGWSAAAPAAGNAAAFAAAGVWGFVAVGVLLERDDPEFLQHWMPPEPGPRSVARALVLLLWAQGVPWLPALAVWLRHGQIAGWVLVTGLLTSLVAVLVVLASVRAQAWSLRIYGPLAAMAAAATAAWTTGWTA